MSTTPKFSKDQKVRIVNGFHRGRQGRVQFYSSMMDTYDVRIGWIFVYYAFGIPESDLEAIGGEE